MNKVWNTSGLTQFRELEDDWFLCLSPTGEDKKQVVQGILIKHWYYLQKWTARLLPRWSLFDMSVGGMTQEVASRIGGQ